MKHMIKNIERAYLDKIETTKEVGNRGEDLAVMFLVKQGFKILARNYRKKWGEIDIIAEKEGIFHFIEVKSVSRETHSDVIHETIGDYRAEERIDRRKVLHMKRTIESFLMDYHLYDQEFQIDVAVVTFYKNGAVPTVEYLDNFVL